MVHSNFYLMFKQRKTVTFSMNSQSKFARSFSKRKKWRIWSVATWSCTWPLLSPWPHPLTWQIVITASQVMVWEGIRYLKEKNRINFFKKQSWICCSVNYWNLECYNVTVKRVKRLLPTFVGLLQKKTLVRATDSINAPTSARHERVHERRARSSRRTTGYTPKNYVLVEILIN